ncbi:MAG: hypothetical protein IPJ79_13050 [Bacteroidetes bacterium]|nr:hypothetical protein [Bacteroidota bacterium]
MYTLIFSKAGHVTKSALFDTRVPKDLENQLIQARKFGMDLFKVPDGAEIPKEVTKPVVKFSWSDAIEDFDYDKDYADARKEEMDGVKKQMEEQIATIEKAKADSLTKARAR